MHRETIETYNDPEVAAMYTRECSRFWASFPTGMIGNFGNNLPRRNRLVLSAGSGTGIDALLLRNSGLEVVCLDAAAAMAKATKKLGFDTIQADFMHIPVPDRTFGGLWSYRAIINERRHRLPEILEEYNRVLCRDGTLCVGVIRGDREKVNFMKGTNRRRQVTSYTESQLEQALENANFRIYTKSLLSSRYTTYLTYLARKKDKS